MLQTRTPVSPPRKTYPGSTQTHKSQSAHITMRRVLDRTAGCRRGDHFHLLGTAMERDECSCSCTFIQHRFQRNSSFLHPDILVSELVVCGLFVSGLFRMWTFLYVAFLYVDFLIFVFSLSGLLYLNFFVSGLFGIWTFLYLDFFVSRLPKSAFQEPIKSDIYRHVYPCCY